MNPIIFRSVSVCGCGPAEYLPAQYSPAVSRQAVPPSMAGVEVGLLEARAAHKAEEAGLTRPGGPEYWDSLKRGRAGRAVQGLGQVEEYGPGGVVFSLVLVLAETLAWLLVWPGLPGPASEAVLLFLCLPSLVTGAAVLAWRCCGPAPAPPRLLCLALLSFPGPALLLLYSLYGLVRGRVAVPGRTLALAQLCHTITSR